MHARSSRCAAAEGCAAAADTSLSLPLLPSLRPAPAPSPGPDLAELRLVDGLFAVLCVVGDAVHGGALVGVGLGQRLLGLLLLQLVLIAAVGAGRAGSLSRRCCSCRCSCRCRILPALAPRARALVGCL